MAEQNQEIEEAKKSLVRMQEFDAKSIVRTEDLGRKMDFSAAVKPVQNLVDMYRRLPESVLGDFARQQIKLVKNHADADYNLFSEALSFDPAQSNSEQRDNIVREIEAAYERTFTELYPLISYSVSKTADFKRLESDARATVQGIEDRARETQQGLEAIRDEAKSTLENVRQGAAEHGVTQQAIYFQMDADAHEKEAKKWQWRTICMAGILVVITILSLFFHKLPGLEINEEASLGYSAVQLIASKVLIFAALAYLLLICGKSYFSHRHNAIVNRHRQNALLTYEALVKAASEGGDIVLHQAARCIFSPQESGYIKIGSGKDYPIPIIEPFRRGLRDSEADE